jgi:hypothetical protein
MITLVLACGNETPAPSSTTATAPATSVAETTELAEAPLPPAAPADEADCDRVRPCAEAFVALVPPELAAPAHVAAEQLDHSLAASPARAAACSSAMASFRADLTRLSIEIPESCRAGASAP